MSKRKLPNPFAEKVMTADKLALKTAPDAMAVPKSINKTKLVLVVAGMVAAGIVVGVYLLFWGSEEAAAPKENKEAAATKTELLAPPVSDDYDADQKKLDTELSEASTDTQKAEIYIRKVELAIINKGFADSKALESAKQAEQLAPSTATALMLANIYSRSDKKTEAVAYYKVYLSRMTEADKQANPGNYEHFQRLVQELEK